MTLSRVLVQEKRHQIRRRPWNTACVGRSRDRHIACSFMKVSTVPSVNIPHGDIMCVSLDSLCTVFNLSAASCGSHNDEFRLFCQSWSSFTGK